MASLRLPRYKECDHAVCPCACLLAAVVVVDGGRGASGEDSGGVREGRMHMEERGNIYRASRGGAGPRAGA
ncbi:hypothetical protein E2C01_032934 [Portunus trituberculatus]|uniref:Uncharacterized protein n=1 Tax=Portunus trituberculatus TaxID=210409 RepID=A0A5B7F2E5_PORTR|nr:hypothetical protein [Portunus trituberculatus]